MAQKKRGLGRGLQALIPEAQTENPAQRPSDVFFPRTHGSGRGEADGTVPATGGTVDAASVHAAEIASTLLAPSKRMTAGRKGGKRKRSLSTDAGPAVAGSETLTPQATADVAADVAGRVSAGVASGVASASVLPQKGGVSLETAEDVSRETSSAGRADHAVAGENENVRTGAGGAGEVEATAPVRTGADVSRETSGEEAVSDLVPVPGATFAELPTALIAPNPRQPRQVFDEDDIAELAASIREVGLLQPIVVRRVDVTTGAVAPEVDSAGAASGIGGAARGDGTYGVLATTQDESSDSQLETRYELIMGERRLRAAKEAGLETIPAVVRYTEDDDLLRDALLENLHRVQLNPLEEAAAYQQLLEDFGCTHAELSAKIARSRSQISNTLRLMKLPALVQRRVAAGVLSAGHARALLGLPDGAAMERLAQRIVAEGLSVRATEELVALHDEPDDAPVKKAARSRAQALPALSGRLSDVFDTRVKVSRGAKKGKITIEFAGEDDLARIVAVLAPGTEIDE